MKIKPIFQSDEWWKKTMDYAKNCSWNTEKSLAKQMKGNDFSDWERVFIALENENITGYCKFVKKDCILNVDYTPYIGFVFVGEPYRGNRISEK
jgi:hypothetical protein